MKIKKFLIFFLISIFTFVEIPQAQPLPIATTYTQGIYNMTQYTGKYITGKLITPDKPLTAIVIDSNGKQKTFVRLDTLNEIVKLGPVQEEDILALIGTGEVSFSPL